jgi:hypothetical protein
MLRQALDCRLVAARQSVGRVKGQHEPQGPAPAHDLEAAHLRQEASVSRGPNAWLLDTDRDGGRSLRWRQGDLLADPDALGRTATGEEVGPNRVTAEAVGGDEYRIHEALEVDMAIVVAHKQKARVP